MNNVFATIIIAIIGTSYVCGSSAIIIIYYLIVNHFSLWVNWQLS